MVRAAQAWSAVPAASLPQWRAAGDAGDAQAAALLLHRGPGGCVARWSTWKGANAAMGRHQARRGAEDYTRLTMVALPAAVHDLVEAERSAAVAAVPAPPAARRVLDQVDRAGGRLAGSYATLAAELGVSRRTVVRSVQALRALGLLEHQGEQRRVGELVASGDIAGAVALTSCHQIAADQEDLDEDAEHDPYNPLRDVKAARAQRAVDVYLAGKTSCRDLYELGRQLLARSGLPAAGEGAPR